MKKDVFREKLKENLIIQAPDGMADKIMEAIELEAKQVANKRQYSMPGKPILLGLSFFFIFTIIWSFFYEGDQSGQIGELVPNFTIQIPKLDSFSWLFTTMNSYLMVGFLLFIVLEFIQLKRNNFRFN